MLARPEINTREHILLWLAGKEGSFYWPDGRSCACAQYHGEHGDESSYWSGPVHELNAIGRELHGQKICDFRSKYAHGYVRRYDEQPFPELLTSFKELEEAARKVWSKPPRAEL